ncbi:cupin-like domain-domain-containing protein [Phakopsora pachyrhizi]|uniref:Cupin-like domain-domain-containing protein n=1 Tax=Phakopsora pachyrhizi TaxID=170000 RepID=A0AAV0BLM2_PHAPC|nr:cupin-like domain-domain-containing protein [Phakopsora pachyrhizi]
MINRLSDELNVHLVYLDVDFEQLIRRKLSIIRSSTELSSKLSKVRANKVEEVEEVEEVEVDILIRGSDGRSSYGLIGYDLNSPTEKLIEDKILKLLKRLRPPLRKLKNDGVVPELNYPTLFISEVSTVYMPSDKSDRLIRDLSKAFKNSIWSSLEQIIPKDHENLIIKEEISEGFNNHHQKTFDNNKLVTAFSEKMFEHFNRLKTPLRGTQTYQSITDQSNRFRSISNYSSFENFKLKDIWETFNRDERLRVLNLDEFDEWEEIDMFLSHYSLTISYSNSDLMRDDITRHQKLFNDFYDSVSNKLKLNSWKDLKNSTIDDQINGKIVGSLIESINLRLDQSSFSFIQRRAHTTTHLGHNSYLIFGGFGSSFGSKRNSESHSRLSDPIILEFDHRSFSLRSSSLNCSDDDRSLPSARLYHSMCLIRSRMASDSNDDDDDDVGGGRKLLKNQCFLFGGRTSPLKPLNDAHLFDPKTYTWKVIKPRSTNQPWPTPRFRHAALVLSSFNDEDTESDLLNVGDDDLVLIHGGIGTDGAILSDTWIFDPMHLSWIRLDFLDQHLGGHRHSHQIYHSPLQNQIYVFGGISTEPYHSEQPRISSPTKIGSNLKIIINLDDLRTQVRSLAKHCDGVTSSDSFRSNILVEEFKLSNQVEDRLMGRYSHKVISLTEDGTRIMMSGGLWNSGTIPTNYQNIIIDLKEKTCSLALTIFDGKPLRIMVGHTISPLMIKVPKNENLDCEGGSRGFLKVRMVLSVGGGATCFSFGSRFDSDIILLSVSNQIDIKSLRDRSIEEHQADVKEDLERSDGTFDSSVLDTWNREVELDSIGSNLIFSSSSSPLKESINSKMIDLRSILLESRPKVIKNFDIGPCKTRWKSKDYLKQKVGKKRVSVHVSDDHSDKNHCNTRGKKKDKSLGKRPIRDLNFHEKNFTYRMMSFEQLVDSIFKDHDPEHKQQLKQHDGDSMNCKEDRTIYLRSLSNSPKRPTDFFRDFREISDDFVIPEPVRRVLNLSRPLEREEKPVEDSNSLKNEVEGDRKDDGLENEACELLTEGDGQSSRLFSSVLRVSSIDMGLWAHYDSYDNFLIQVVGRKLVKLWNPSEIINLYILGSSSVINRFENSKPSIGDQSNKLRSEAVDEDEEDEVLKKFPLFRKSKPFITILEPGDFLFIPSTWIHSVKSLEPSISINLFFKTLSIGSSELYKELYFNDFVENRKKLFRESLNDRKAKQNNKDKKSEKNSRFKRSDCDDFFKDGDFDVWGNYDLLPYKRIESKLKKRLSMITSTVKITDKSTERTESRSKGCLEDSDKVSSSKVMIDPIDEDNNWMEFNRLLNLDQKKFYLKKLGIELIRFSDKL